MTERIELRLAHPDDAPQLLDIYAPYVEHTAITFEYRVPLVAEFRRRITKTMQNYPYLVATKGGRLLGYAYLGRFGARKAYDWAAETSIYVARDARHQGVGAKLYAAIEQLARLMGLTNLNACIAYPSRPDPHLTANSAEFHQHLGYRLVGRFHQCGYKFDRWYDMVWMEKIITDHPVQAQAVDWFAQLLREHTAAVNRILRG